MARGAAKAAELASGLGAIVLGAGLALLVPDAFRGYAIPILVAGILVHGVGMSLKHRLEAVEREPLWWEQRSSGSAGCVWACWQSGCWSVCSQPEAGGCSSGSPAPH